MPKLSTQVDSGWKRALGFFLVEIDADATGGLEAPMPEDGEIVDVIVRCTDNNVDGDVRLSYEGDNITDAIDMDSDTEIERAGTIDDDYSTRSAGDTITFTTTGAGDRGLVTVVYLPR